MVERGQLWIGAVSNKNERTACDRSDALRVVIDDVRQPPMKIDGSTDASLLL